MKRIRPDEPEFRYSGRVDLSRADRPVLVWPASAIHVRVSGTRVAFRLKNLHNYWDNAVSLFVDGEEIRIPLKNRPWPVTYRVTLPASRPGERNESAVENPNRPHRLSTGNPAPLREADPGSPAPFRELILHKSQGGGSSYIEFHGLFIENGAKVAPAAPPPARRIECFGDSVSAGEVCECAEYEGKTDPADHKGRYDNAWKSYVAVAARALGAELHDTSQGGIAVMDGTGYFVNGKVGLESVWDRLRYNPELGKTTRWDFSRWTPHVVVMALGQNDAHPVDFIDRDPALRARWLETYGSVIRSLRANYPRALFVVLTTILEHREAWDLALDELVSELRTDHGGHGDPDKRGDSRVVRFRFTRNGRGTPGHPRVGEHEEMAAELVAFLESLGGEVWEG